MHALASLAGTLMIESFFQWDGCFGARCVFA
jgi:hypothetical protein